MKHTELSFPRRELAGSQHQQIRDLLVREAAPTIRQKPARLRVIVPAAALAVTAAVGGAAVVTGTWGDPLGVADPAAPVGVDAAPRKAPDCDNARRVSPTAGDGLRYLRAAPVGWTYTSWLNEVKYCSDDTDPMVSFVRQTANGTVTAALTVWRSLPPNIGADPEGVANGTADTSPTDGDDVGTVMNPLSSPVSVRSRPGRLIRNDTLTWIEPGGQRWAVTGSGLTPGQLTDIASGLVLDQGSVSWSNAAAQGFDRLSIPRAKELKEASWQPKWYVCYEAEDPGECTLSVEVDRQRLPWQAWLSQPTGHRPVRLVEVNGRLGMLTDNGAATAGILQTSTADGAQVFLMGSVPAASTLVGFAEQLKQVAADDPLIHEPQS